MFRLHRRTVVFLALLLALTAPIASVGAPVARADAVATQTAEEGGGAIGVGMYCATLFFAFSLGGSNGLQTALHLCGIAISHLIET